jgi:hypothetical protein
VEMTLMRVEQRKIGPTGLIVIDLYRFRNYAGSLVV